MTVQWRALLSVSDKQGLIELAEKLTATGWELVATEGTATFLKEKGILALPVAEITGLAPMLDGRVKTLHPRLAAGLLADLDNERHRRELDEAGITPIQLVVVNLYPFREVIAQKDTSLSEAMENIDIGGVTLLRAAAKNFRHVLAVCDPVDYPLVVENPFPDAWSLELRRRLAAKAFRHTTHYDRDIARYLSEDELGAAWDWPLFPEGRELRYGENPHQRAFWIYPADEREGLAAAKQLQGKPLSYNNLTDAAAAWQAVLEFDRPAAVAVKHGTPCGAAVADDLAAAFRRARDGDPQSIFGGIVALNRPVDGECAAELAGLFLEVILAPEFTLAARERLARKKRLRLLELPLELAKSHWSLHSLPGGWLAQELDPPGMGEEAWQVVTKRQPTATELEDLRFAWRVVKHVRSNAAVVARDGATLGIGGGQTSRVWAVENALTRATGPTTGAVLASDGFFPFPDSVELAARAGITAVIQPGGSKRDAESIAVCDANKMTMIFTGRRAFRHG